MSLPCMIGLHDWLAKKIPNLHHSIPQQLSNRTGWQIGIRIMDYSNRYPQQSSWHTLQQSNVARKWRPLKQKNIEKTSCKCWMFRFSSRVWLITRGQPPSLTCFQCWKSPPHEALPAVETCQPYPPSGQASGPWKCAKKCLESYQTMETSMGFEGKSAVMVKKTPAFGAAFL